MSAESDATTAGRRAAALLVHHASEDLPGVAAVLDELKTPKDTTMLMFGLLGLFEHLLGQLPAEAVEHIRAAVVQLAAREDL